jgi:voltage-gated potassium channel
VLDKRQNLMRRLRKLIARWLDPQTRLERFEKGTEWPLAIVAVVFLAAYSVQVLTPPQGHFSTAMHLVIGITYAIFVVDYLARLILATDRPRWFVRHLVDLAIVGLPLLRPLRLLRLVVLLTALHRAIGGAVRGRVVVYTAFSAVLLLYTGSLAILDYERGHPGSKVNNFGDALWWSISTLTSVGYGDKSPVTAAGRVIAIFLVIGGIGLVGSVTATLASWIVQRVSEEDSEQQAATAVHIEALHEEVRLQMEGLRNEIQQLKKFDTSQQLPPTGHAEGRPLHGSAVLNNGNGLVEASSTDGHRIWCPASGALDA